MLYIHLASRWGKLAETTFLQSHIVMQPVVHILSLIDLFNIKNFNDPINFEVLTRMKTATTNFDTITKTIIEKTSKIETLISKCHRNNYLN